MKRNRLITAAMLAAGIAYVGMPASASAQEPTQPAQPAVEGQPMQPGTFTAAAETHGFREWTRGVQAAGYEQRLATGEFTGFIADDAAYGRVPAETRQAWQTDPAAQRAAIGHTLVEGRYTLDQLRQREYVTTIDGQRLPVRVEGDYVFLGDARIEEGDIAAGTGLIHRVDRVTTPMAPAAPAVQPDPAPLQQPAVQPEPTLQPDPAVTPLREPVRKD